MKRDDTKTAAQALVARTCAEQGVPEQITDSAVVHQIATLMRRPAS